MNEDRAHPGLKSGCLCRNRRAYCRLGFVLETDLGRTKDGALWLRSMVQSGCRMKPSKSRKFTVSACFPARCDIIPTPANATGRNGRGYGLLLLSLEGFRGPQKAVHRADFTGQTGVIRSEIRVGAARGAPCPLWPNHQPSPAPARHNQAHRLPHARPQWAPSAHWP